MTGHRLVVHAALLVFVVVYALYRVRAGRRSPWPAILGALALPFLIPPTWTIVRMLATVWGAVLAFKVWDLAGHGASDPRMLANPARALFWLFIPPDSRVPDDAAQARRTRAAGIRRLVRGLVFVALALGLWAVEIRWPAVHQNPWLEAFWALWLTWAAMAAVSDSLGGLAMLTGWHVGPLFDTPVLARSPRDFWSRRWNLFVHRWMRRHVFVPAGGRRRPLRGIAATFAASALMHEYVVIAGLGRIPEHVGWMTIFFALQGAAVALEAAAMRRFGRGPWLPRPLAVVLHLVWFTATGPLFFAPLGEIFAGW